MHRDSLGRWRVRDGDGARNVCALAPQDQDGERLVVHRVGPGAKEEREERSQLGAAIVYRRGGEQQHPRAYCERRNRSIAPSGRGTGMMRLVQYEQIELSGWHSAPRECAVRHDSGVRAGCRERIAPHRAERGGDHEQRTAGFAYQRCGDVRLAESRLISQQRATMLGEQRAQPIERAPLMIVQQHRPELA